MALIRHTKATKHLARQLNRQDRQVGKAQLRLAPELVELPQPRGRAIWLSY